MTHSINLNTTNTTAQQDIKQRFGDKLNSSLDFGSALEGLFEFNEPTTVNGKILGEIKSNSFLIVGEQAEIFANIDVEGIIILGKVEGEVKARKFVEVRAGAELNSDVYCNNLILENGASFNGRKNNLIKKKLKVS